VLPPISREARALQNEVSSDSWFLGENFEKRVEASLKGLHQAPCNERGKRKILRIAKIEPIVDGP